MLRFDASANHVGNIHFHFHGLEIGRLSADAFDALSFIESNIQLP